MQIPYNSCYARKIYWKGLVHGLRVGAAVLITSIAQANYSLIIDKNTLNYLQGCSLNILLQTTQSLLMLLYCQNLRIPPAKNYFPLGSSQKRTTVPQSLFLSAWIFAITPLTESMCFKIAELILWFQCYCFIFPIHKGTWIFILCFYFFSLLLPLQIFILNLQNISA